MFCHISSFVWAEELPKTAHKILVVNKSDLEDSEEAQVSTADIERVFKASKYNCLMNVSARYYKLIILIFEIKKEECSYAGLFSRLFQRAIKSPKGPIEKYCIISVIYCPLSIINFWFSILNVPISIVQFPFYNIHFPLSILDFFHHPLSIIQYPLSNIPLPFSIVQYSL